MNMNYLKLRQKTKMYSLIQKENNPKSSNNKNVPNLNTGCYFKILISNKIIPKSVSFHKKHKIKTLIFNFPKESLPLIPTKRAKNYFNVIFKFNKKIKLK